MTLPQAGPTFEIDADGTSKILSIRMEHYHRSETNKANIKSCHKAELDPAGGGDFDKVNQLLLPDILGPHDCFHGHRDLNLNTNYDQKLF